MRHQHRLTEPGRVAPLVPPLQQRQEPGKQRPTFIRELVFLAQRPLLVSDLLQHALLHQKFQAIRQDISCYRQLLVKLVEAGQPVIGQRDQVGGPTITHQVNQVFVEAALTGHFLDGNRRTTTHLFFPHIVGCTGTGLVGHVARVNQAITCAAVHLGNKGLATVAVDQCHPVQLRRLVPAAFPGDSHHGGIVQVYGFGCEMVARPALTCRFHILAQAIHFLQPLQAIGKNTAGNAHGLHHVIE